MKKGIKITISLLAVFFFAQVCFAPYTINPEIPNIINDPDERQRENDIRQKTVKVLVIVGVVVLIAGVVYLVYLFWLLMQYGNSIYGGGA